MRRRCFMRRKRFNSNYGGNGCISRRDSRRVKRIINSFFKKSYRRSGYTSTGKYTFAYENKPLFDSIEEFFNFLFGISITLIIFITIFKLAPEILDPHGVIDIRDIMNNNTNKTENVRVINRRKINTTNTPNSPF